MAVARTQTYDQRADILNRLLGRNRLVALLRVLVPAAGVATLLILMGQIWIANLARQYGVSGIRIDRGKLVVETPQYSETGADGSRYLVVARDARTPLANPDSIEMTEPRLTFERPDKSPMRASGAVATVDTGRHYVTVPGVTHVSSDDGLFGTLTELRSDMRAQITIAQGPVDLTFPDGSHLTADNMIFNGNTAIYNFDRATLVIPNLPKPHANWANVFLVFATEGAQ